MLGLFVNHFATTASRHATAAENDAWRHHDDNEQTAERRADEETQHVIGHLRQEHAKIAVTCVSNTPLQTAAVGCIQWITITCALFK